MSEPTIFERPISWGHAMDAIRHSSAVKLDHGQVGDETSCVLSFCRGLQLRKIRNWLDVELDRNFQMNGLFLSEPLDDVEFVPVALRFVFDTYDDKIFFALRWL